MAGPYYVDPAAAGGATGADWANAWTTLQTALDTATAGEIIYCRGTETLGATMDVDTQTGSNAAGWIKVIGCNAAGNVDGTRFVLDGNGGGFQILYAAATSDMYWLENIEFKNTGAGAFDGVAAAAGTSGWVFINCCANNCGRYGFAPGNFPQSLFLRCVAYANTSNGFYYGNLGTYFLFCCSRDSAGGSGFTTDTSSTTPIIGCISHGNGDDGVTHRLGQLIMNCVIDGNADDGIAITSRTDLQFALILACRITNHSGAGDIGLNANSEPCITGWCYFEDNDGDNVQNATLHQFIPAEGGSTTSNIEDQANTDAGYVDSANHDFSTRYVDAGDPDLRRTAITVPWS